MLPGKINCKAWLKMLQTCSASLEYTVRRKMVEIESVIESVVVSYQKKTCGRIIKI